jgi:hypothetical protein
VEEGSKIIASQREKHVVAAIREALKKRAQHRIKTDKKYRLPYTDIFLRHLLDAGFELASVFRAVGRMRRKLPGRCRTYVCQVAALVAES